MPFHPHIPTPKQIISPIYPSSHKNPEQKKLFIYLAVAIAAISLSSLGFYFYLNRNSDTQIAGAPAANFGQIVDLNDSPTSPQSAPTKIAWTTCTNSPGHSVRTLQHSGKSVCITEGGLFSFQ